MTEVLVAQRWRDNAELIQAVFEMHVFPHIEGRPPFVLDVTYGRGKWWKWVGDFGPNGIMLMHHDLKTDGIDYRKLPEVDNFFDVVAFDPDYIAPGGRKTSTIPEFNDRYGLKGSYETPADLQVYINEGLTECARVVKPQGLILVKCMNYISSGHPVLGEVDTINHGRSLGLKVHDIFRPIFDPGPQPPDRRCGKCEGEGWLIDLTAMQRGDCDRCGGTGRIVPRQQHARANSSTLMVFRKPGRRKR